MDVEEGYFTPKAKEGLFYSSHSHHSEIFLEMQIKTFGETIRLWFQLRWK